MVLAVPVVEETMTVAQCVATFFAQVETKKEQIKQQACLLFYFYLQQMLIIYIKN